ncbi:hypothetical protein JMA_38940 (plasmid) [Jeotgalibacillus malaysiensis]|uniref:Uncharacterized protein n=1 Tax=Jeotgalibacillus malaysiensis TaxID=1508404 RepID=A0A0B5AWZ7_9BACL|nr:hypothetical protein [Jeotgalibacillus malaysiensis]AJD93212.1 hypothetical protein JMA_38940 [Jeotgalibacillus malaysiensis]
MGEIIVSVLFLLILFLSVGAVVLMKPSIGSEPSVITEEEWIYPKEDILIYGDWSFEFGGFPNEKTLLFYERHDEGNHPVYLQITEGKEMKMVVDGDSIIVTEVDKENNRIKVKMQEPE